MTAIVVVESPAKARTINKFLGAGYEVIASYGHIRDLPKKNGSVLPEEGFRMCYEVPKTSQKHVDAIAKAVKKADTLLLATDPDREGEAISWHVLEALREKNVLGKIPVKRVVFHEITQRAIQEAIAHAREVDMDMVNAQQARRALDYLVGFNLSPLLWKKVRRGLSAGRVQSVALRLVCERENEIRAFKAQEYWSIIAEVEKTDTPQRFPARLAVAGGEKLDKFSIPDAARANELVAAIKDQPLFLTELEKKQVKRNPAPPFITSTLQQEASRKLGFSARKTMSTAQQLYEGVEVPTPDGGKEVVGLITYMRTDSVNLAAEAVTALRDLVKERYGAQYLPKTERRFKSSTKNAQEAHEAVRPTDPRRIPEQLAKVLPKDLLRLYDLIWKRAVACQMEAARIDQVSAVLAVGKNDPNAPYRLKATGSSVAFDGFRKVYDEGTDAVSAQDRDDDENAAMLPPLTKGETLRQTKLEPHQHFTEPPPRYTEASLVKALESYGIGRPSTYAPTMSTIQDRGYARLEKKQFHPEDLGLVVNTFLVQHFARYVDYNFTAHLEDELDAVSRGEKAWVPLLDTFWKPFISQIQEKEQSTKKSEITSEATDEVCPTCGKPVMIKLGRFGRFKACSGYPECRFTENIKKQGTGESSDTAAPASEPVISDRKCDKCGSPMQIKEGRYGKFLACTGYPKCSNIQPLEKPKETNVPCPECKKGTFLEKKSRRGKLFYSCSRYPDCKKALWNYPLPIPCPLCKAPFLTQKITKRRGTEHVCATEGCTYKVVVAPPNADAPEPEADAE
ncbi:MAG: type I DNA topoisomerase [Magnetococcus sp. DMHC-1]|nr:type I DNA topoisomerase [Magnetococcales bacterium]MBF0155208.1 type I DNA topoisomerase [Magnetococcales bacterium]